MYIVKNALRNVLIGWGRNVLICLIALVIATSACIALSIRQAAAKAKEAALEDINITATISANRRIAFNRDDAENSDKTEEEIRKEMQQRMASITDLTVDDLLKYSKAESVKSFTYSISSSLDANADISPVDVSFEGAFGREAGGNTNGPSFEAGGDDPGERKGGPNFIIGGGAGTQGDFTIIGYSSFDSMTDFVNGTSKITSGKMFDENTSDPVCVISSELASLNSIKTGDKITLVNPNDEEETFEFTVSGIYESDEASSAESGEMRGFGPQGDSSNRIYTSYKSLKSIAEKSEANATTETDEETGIEKTTAIRTQANGTYSFASKEDFESFQTQAEELGLSEDYTISSPNSSSFETSVAPLESLSEYATYFFWIVLIIGGIILVLINIFSIRDRKYEVGVLTAIGMKKSKVALQFVTELFVVTFIAIILGTTTGAAVSLPVTNELLKAQVEAKENESDNIENNFGFSAENGRGMTRRFGGGPDSMLNINQDANFIDQVDSATDFTVIFQLVLIGIALTLISSLVAIIFISRYEPLKILSNRD